MDSNLRRLVEERLGSQRFNNVYDVFEYLKSVLNERVIQKNSEEILAIWNQSRSQTQDPSRPSTSASAVDSHNDRPKLPRCDRNTESDPISIFNSNTGKFFLGISKRHHGPGSYITKRILCDHEVDPDKDGTIVIEWKSSKLKVEICRTLCTSVTDEMAAGMGMGPLAVLFGSDRATQIPQQRQFLQTTEASTQVSQSAFLNGHANHQVHDEAAHQPESIRSSSEMPIPPTSGNTYLGNHFHFYGPVHLVGSSSLPAAPTPQTMLGEEAISGSSNKILRREVLPASPTAGIYPATRGYAILSTASSGGHAPSQSINQGMMTKEPPIPAGLSADFSGDSFSESSQKRAADGDIVSPTKRRRARKQKRARQTPERSLDSGVMDC